MSLAKVVLVRVIGMDLTRWSIRTDDAGMIAFARPLTTPTRTARPRLMSRGVLAVLVSGAGTSASLYVLLTAVPMYAATGVAGGVAAGLTSGALMLSSVAAELATPILVARFGYRAVFGAGLILLGAPALLLPVSNELAIVLAICVARGLGFGITVVVGAALAARLAPAERRGESLGLYGVVSNIPAVAMLPLGAWLVGEVGFASVFVLGALGSLAMVVVLPWLPGRGLDRERHGGLIAGLRTPTIARPALVFAATTVAAGIVVTFLPLTATATTVELAATALLVQAVAATASRWWAGRESDRKGAGPLLLPGLLITATGVAVVAVATPFTLIAGMVLFGAGFGIVQSASLSAMLARVPGSAFIAVGAIWSIAYDAGWGLGSTAFGLVAVQTGYPVAFGLTAGAMLVAVLPAWRDRRAPAVGT
jgi:predicted MFS family arabinose efflux permease